MEKVSFKKRSLKQVILNNRLDFFKWRYFSCIPWQPIPQSGICNAGDSIANFPKGALKKQFWERTCLHFLMPQRWPWELRTIELWHHYVPSYAASCSHRWYKWFTSCWRVNTSYSVWCYQKCKRAFRVRVESTHFSTGPHLQCDGYSSGWLVVGVLRPGNV